MAVVSLQHCLAKRPFVRFKKLENERYLKRLNCELTRESRVETEWRRLEGDSLE